jgi:hypothetical protein
MARSDYATNWPIWLGTAYPEGLTPDIELFTKLGAIMRNWFPCLQTNDTRGLCGIVGASPYRVPTYLGLAIGAAGHSRSGSGSGPNIVGNDRGRTGRGR